MRMFSPHFSQRHLDTLASRGGEKCGLGSHKQLICLIELKGITSQEKSFRDIQSSTVTSGWEITQLVDEKSRQINFLRVFIVPGSQHRILERVRFQSRKPGQSIGLMVYIGCFPDLAGFFCKDDLHNTHYCPDEAAKASEKIAR